MNAQTKIKAALPSPAYDADGYGWAMAQGRFLRERRFDAVDWDNIAEEIETMGRSERRSLESNLMQAALHILKWDIQPERRGMSWWLSIMNHREAAQRDLRENPSLRSQLDAIFADALVTARRNAAGETRLDPNLVASSPLTLDDVFERTFTAPTGE
jgi:Domain of unknown function DUF29